MYTTKRLLAVLLSVMLVLSMVSVSFAAEETIGVSLSASDAEKSEALTCETSSYFELYFGADKFSIGEKVLNTYEFTVWYDDYYVTLDTEELTDVLETEGYAMVGKVLEKTVDDVDYTGRTFTYTSYKKGFGEAKDESFNALVELPFKAESRQGKTIIFIEAEGISLLPVANPENFTDKLEASLLNGEVEVTIESADDSSNGSFFGGGAGSSTVKRTVIFNVDGVKTSVIVSDGKKVARPAVPVKDGYAFVGWYKEKTFENLYDFNIEVTDSIELFAKFEKIAGGDVQVSALPFADVKADDWYYESVKYVFEQNMVKGLSETAYGPDNTLTRATLVTLLYRMENEPEAPANAFSDILSGAWYENAVAWASSNEIVLGVGAGQFAPDLDITREQIAVILYKYSKLKGKDVSKTADLTAFADASEISDWAKEALSWAVAEGLIQGMGGNTVAPTATANRAQIAAILTRYMN